ncbi:hypothetical protein POM88_035557 [Heracleum sosnowskyi]|uniref:Uncharacterized protein n=1 Tax=Heracleum sosnowskyi TaxID=360622 RepID=A0AAD8MBN0_9APIA|nr:hypothetical protein POM88_035557 [Heracleum sosnowskyi]
MVYEKPEAEGRYICTTHTVNTQDLVEMLKRLYPEHEYPKSFTAAAAGEKHSSEKHQTLGWSFSGSIIDFGSMILDELCSWKYDFDILMNCILDELDGIGIILDDLDYVV